MEPRRNMRSDYDDNTRESLEDIAAEMDLEISLRRRLTEAIESRISWAVVLQQSLQKESSGKVTSFKSSAFDALSAIERPLEVVFVQETSPVPRPIIPQIARVPRPPPKHKNVAIRKSGTSFLYIKSADIEPPHAEIRTYLLRCPTCSRTAFTSLQGLLNHARLSHGLEWGTHDECVKACAVIDPEIDTHAGVEVGIGYGGILPGLRSLFQMAVGTHTKVSTEDTAPTSDSIQNIPSSLLTRTLGLHEDTPALAPFLGKEATRRSIKVEDEDDIEVDIDTFEQGNQNGTYQQLGTVVFDVGRPHTPKRLWRMPYRHRNDFEPPNTTASATNEGDGFVEQPLIITHESENRDKRQTPEHRETRGFDDLSTVNLPTSNSRFHFVTRIIVTDRSLWIPPERRQNIPNDYTHKWMLSVDSPSYSHNITTILQKMSVSSLSDPMMMSQTLTTTDPPFVIVGTTDRPFLAKIELAFNGSPGPSGKVVDQTVLLEHWVELDLMKGSAPVMGDEQVVDIELDKGTILMPLRTNNPIGPKALWNLDTQPRNGTGRGGKNGSPKPVQGYGKILSSLLPKFPMTLKDIKSGRAPHPSLPYKLVSTPAQLKNLVHGRRKAIEWGRALALQTAYNQVIQDSQLIVEGAVPLTTADVFTWLSERGHFLKPPIRAPETGSEIINKIAANEPEDFWCPVCGQGAEIHSTIPVIKQEVADAKQSAAKMEGVIGHVKPTQLRTQDHDHNSPFQCNIVPVELQLTRFPMQDMTTSIGPYRRSVYNTAQNYPSGASTIKINMGCARPRELVSASDPNLILPIENIIRSLNLPSFSSLRGLHPGWPTRQLPLEALGSDRRQVEAHIAPYAMLALVTKQFLRRLIDGGVEVAKREKAVATGLATSRRRRKSGKDKSNPPSILTPMHIVSSIVSRGQGRNHRHDEVDAAILGCLGRLGVPAFRNDLSQDTAPHSDTSNVICSVKMECS